MRLELSPLAETDIEAIGDYIEVTPARYRRNCANAANSQLRIPSNSV